MDANEQAAEMVILVDEEDEVVGTADKLEAHRAGLLHRAISVVLFGPRGRVLLQQRAATKYHSPLLWANACCSHPRPGENTEAAAHRRLAEELGIEADLRYAGQFIYRAELDGGLIEHELDHVFVGEFDGEPEPDPAEVAEWRWARTSELEADLSAQDPNYVVWLADVLQLAQRA